MTLMKPVFARSRPMVTGASWLLATPTRDTSAVAVTSVHRILTSPPDRLESGLASVVPPTSGILPPTEAAGHRHDASIARFRVDRHGPHRQREPVLTDDAGRATHQVRAGHQLENRQGPGPHDPAVAAASGGSSDRMMNRRTFLCWLTLGGLASPRAAGAQPAGKMYRIAILANEPSPAIGGL